MEKYLGVSRASCCFADQIEVVWGYFWYILVLKCYLFEQTQIFENSYCRNMKKNSGSFVGLGFRRHYVSLKKNMFQVWFRLTASAQSQALSAVFWCFSFFQKWQANLSGKTVHMFVRSCCLCWTRLILWNGEASQLLVWEKSYQHSPPRQLWPL